MKTKRLALGIFTGILLAYSTNLTINFISYNNEDNKIRAVEEEYNSTKIEAGLQTMIFIATAENLTLEDKEEMNVKFDLLMQKSKQLEELLNYHASKANKYYHQALNPLFYFKKE